MSATKRKQASKISGRVFSIAFALALVAVAASAITLWFARKDPHGPILHARTLGDDVVLLRRGYEERGYVHLIRMDPRSNTPRWSEALYGLEPAPALTVTEDRVLVRAREARGHAELHVFDHAGTFAWRGGRGQYESPEGNPAFSARPLWTDGEVVFLVHATDPVEIVVLDLDDGHERARAEVPLGEGPRGAALGSAGLFIESGDRALRRIGRDGEVAVIHEQIAGWCLTDEGLYWGTDEALFDEEGPVAVIPSTVAICTRDGRVARTSPEGLRVRSRTGVFSLVPGIALDASVNRVVDRFAVISGGVVDLHESRVVDSGSVDLRDGEVVRVGEIEIARAADRLVRWDLQRAVRVPGVIGIAGAWGVKADGLFPLDPELDIEGAEPIEWRTP